MTDKDIKICGHGSGKPSIKNLHDYAEQRYKQKAPNGKRKGIVCVRRHKKMTDKLGEDFVKTYKTIIGRNIYNQNRRKYDAIVYFTDGYCSIPADTPKDCLWVISSKGDQSNINKYKVNGASAVFIPKQD